MRVYLASRNPGKLRELRALLPGWELEPLDVTSIGEEVGETFRENARGKAASIQAVGYIAKPISIDTLLDEVERICGLAEA